MSKLSGYVVASGPEGTVILSPDDPLPAWANRETIPNPKAWDGTGTDQAPGTGTDQAPGKRR